MIDYSFIEGLEGAHRLNAYVPLVGNSGVTISTGVDLGQFSIRELLDILGKENHKLISRLSFYSEYTKREAITRLKERPLTITQPESELIALKFKEYFERRLREDWDSKSITQFDSLPDGMQTVLFSLGYNFGVPLSKSLPKTFSLAKQAAEEGNYKTFIHWLEVFPSKNIELVNRRKKEAEYLKLSTAQRFTNSG